MGISEEKKKWLLAKFGKAPEPKASKEKSLAEVEKEWLARAESSEGGAQKDLGARIGTPPQRNGPVVRVCMGFDLGTSCSKVVVRAMAPRFALAMSFGDGERHGLPSLLPTRLFVSPDGVATIQQRHGIAPVVDLKIELMRRPNESLQLGSNRSLQCRPIDLVSAYLGQAIRMSREQFKAKARERLPAGAKLKWAFNLGLPARSQDDKVVNQAFTTAAHAGWKLSWADRPVSLRDVMAIVDGVRSAQTPLGAIDYHDIATVPEVTAEATGYARSSLRRYGTHLMVDVGATTLDACLFILFDRGGEYCYTLLDADVNSALGAIGLQKRRMEEVATLIARANPFQKVAASVHDYLRDASRCEGLELVDQPFADDCVSMLRGVVYRAKLKAPDDLNEFLDTHAQRQRGADSPLRVIVCGGGARVGLYSTAIGALETQVRSGGGYGLTVKPFEVLARLPKPEGLEMPHEMTDHYDRLAVAYGLSFPVDNIGHFIPPSQVANAPLKRVRISADMTTKDFV